FANIVMAQEKKHLEIRVTNPYLYDIIERVTCEARYFKTESLMPFGTDPHHFQLSPEHRLAIAKADVIFSIGSHFEPWLDKIKPTQQQRWLAVSKFLILRKISTIHSEEKNTSSEHEKETAEHSHNHHHFEYDAHIWHSPQLTKNVARLISEELKKIKPESARQIQGCLLIFLKEIDETVSFLKKEVEKLPKENRIIATQHDSFGYFAEEFEFKTFPLLGLSNYNSPTPAEIKKMLLTIKAHHIRALFPDSLGETAAIQMIAKSAKIKVGGKLYSDTLEPKGNGPHSILELWKTNMKTILKALNP
ncbi:MAG: metal ABC transporter substrate-binding protein, partial [Silvanigrellaceae bacterium]|nr:metal ABC transporter substrate-binding protein [Silvanigrellaceae bacterium]